MNTYYKHKKCSSSAYIFYHSYEILLPLLLHLPSFQAAIGKQKHFAQIARCKMFSETKKYNSKV